MAIWTATPYVTSTDAKEAQDDHRKPFLPADRLVNENMNNQIFNLVQEVTPKRLVVGIDRILTLK